ncbi:hypothetical protein EDB81DRAFT_61622 [Dactylonectria macrodidyma]|uniref:Uncharacterized protein n=1 Tax=Dactylonectria macrodidyma TaxID=307937 RepID=A0A9P9IYN7_9HYPO|nr:hypothetical protein EDB81DRAFT_61622 [Dactylonectria macrodidyma]
MAESSSRDPQSGPAHRRHAPRGIFAPEIVDLFLPPLKVGGWAGTAGVLAGVGGSIFKEGNPVAWGAVSGFQWFTLGTSFWFTRSVTIKAWGGEEGVTPSDRTKASAIAGGAAGAVGGLIRGPSNILPAIFCWTVFGAGGQMIVNHMATRAPKVKDENDSWFRSKWSPLKKLTDAEYIDLMEEKILRVDADIALIDDRVSELRKKPQEETSRNTLAS